MSAIPSRVLGRTGRTVSSIGLGTWQLGADWGEVTEADARAVLDASLDAGVTFFDTADVYGDGRSETLIGAWRRDQADPEGITVATKIGRRVELVPELHCPPTPVYSIDRVFDDLDTLTAEGAIASYGVSVETSAEALTSIARPHLASVQIVLNAFRLKPLDAVLPAAQDAGVGIIARVPLASGLLTGRYTHDTAFAADDHRNYNRDGSSFDRGETFAGVDYDEGVEAAKEFSALAAAAGLEPARAALAWVAQLPGVSVVIPGARNPEQARANASAGEVADLGPDFTAAVRELYDRRFRAAVHSSW
jgi:aryl-alcohol dehydrogenase-like predicted oxidoreductase